MPTENQTGSKPSENSLKQLEGFIKETLNKEMQTVHKQFEQKTQKLKQEIQQKETIISIKDNQTQKFALLRVNEEKDKKDKKEWIKKYEAEHKKNNLLMIKYSQLKIIVIFALLFIII